MNIVSLIQENIKKFIFYIFGLLSLAFKRLSFVGKNIPLSNKISDFIEIFRSTFIYFIFNLIALFIFTLLPQGKDVILVAIEDLSNFYFGSLISLIIGLTCWSIISEFGARYKVYVTDNSGKSLTDEQVNYRKEVQRIVSIFYLLLPVIIVIVSVLIVAFTTIKDWHWTYIWPFIVVFGLLLLLFGLLSKLYLDDKFISNLRVKQVWFKVSDKELKWVNKLYGIYNDYILMIRKADNFLDESEKEKEFKKVYGKITDQIESLEDIKDFPRDFIKPDSELPPQDFKPVLFTPDNFQPNFKDPKNFKLDKKEDGYYRWIYKNNPLFYKTLHKQVHVIALSSLIILLLISMKFLIPYDILGSPGLVCLSFGCWLGLYTGLLYIDSRYKGKFIISLRWLVLFWFFFVSFINNDHPVRINSSSCNDNRPSLIKHFQSWFKMHMEDTFKIALNDTSITKKIISDSVIKKDTSYKAYPVFFITAEGGALRTGAFTAMLLAKLQDSFPQFKHNIYAFSTVSGGSVGIAFFNAISYIEPDTTAKKSDYYQMVTRKFFSQDQLSPVIAKMFYADILNDFLPWHIDNFDRAVALEKAWEHSYAEVFKKPSDLNVFSENFLSCYQKENMPAWFINTTEVETGLQCYISSVRADSFLFARDRDLLLNKIRGGINYSTAVNFSSRFPLFSPSAALYQNDDQTYHYVDGGYVENTGAKTMLEILESLHDSINSNHILPYVIQLKFGDSTAFEQTGFLNEISSIIDGIYNTRSGSSLTYTELLKKEVKSLNGQFVEVPLNATANEIPMSWVFSERSLNNLDSVIYKIIKVDTLNDINTKLLPVLSRKRKCKDSYLNLH